MPPLPNVPSCLKIAIQHDAGNDIFALTILHFNYSGGPPSTADANSLAGQIRAGWTTNIAPITATSGGLQSVTVTDLASASGAQGSDLTVVGGTRTGGPLPGGVACLINYSIARRYRGGKPRSYPFLGTATDITTSGTWSGSAVTAFQNGWRAFMAAISAASAGTTVVGAQVNVSYFQGFTVVTNPVTGRTRNVPKLRTGGPLKDTITLAQVNSKPASQRRRNLHSR